MNVSLCFLMNLSDKIVNEIFLLKEKIRLIID